MIELKFKAEFEWSGEPFVCRLISEESNKSSDLDSLFFKTGQRIRFACDRGNVQFNASESDDFDGDIFLCFPDNNRVERLFRAKSTHNSILITERCDQFCVMCSQPPRNTNDAWRFPLYEEAIKLLPFEATICLSGGEPTLYFDELISMIENVVRVRDDINFHILSNGQHFHENQIERLKSLHKAAKLLWGIPIYSHLAHEHEKLVDKEGSFNTLMNNLYILASTGASIELRTVLTAENALSMVGLAKFISEHLSFCAYWAIMAMENIGFAKANFSGLFYDHSIAPQPLHKSIDIASAKGVSVKLFNFPLCSVGERYREFCEQSISDWKRRYLEECDKCFQREHCTGFFEWYDENRGWKSIKALGGVYG